MENPISGNKSAKQQLHTIADSVRDTSEQVGSDLSKRASRFADSASENASEYYNKASTWMQQNYGKTLGAVGIVAAIGVVGYFLGKSNSRSEIPFPGQRT